MNIFKSQQFDSSIFIKQSELKKKEQKLKKEDLKKLIPTTCLENEDIELKKTMVEWRWRIFKINDKTFTEISMIEPNKKRVYLNKYKKWTDGDINPLYDQFVIKKYYYYTT